MTKKVINKEDKTLLKVYIKWYLKKGYTPSEYECSQLINNMNSDHRVLVEDYIKELTQ
jgi:uncharacterized protein YeeX (DUF496 family)